MEEKYSGGQGECHTPRVSAKALELSICAQIFLSPEGLGEPGAAICLFLDTTT